MIQAADHGLGYDSAHRKGAICADVLDAWFPPCAEALEAFTKNPDNMRISPDVQGKPLLCAISSSREVPFDSLSLGSGSSEIIHRVLPRMAGSGPVAVVDPGYSEYLHVLSRDRCDVVSIRLNPNDGFQLHLDALVSAAAGCSMLILVNPNNPTGRSLTRREVLELRAQLDQRTILWVDEAYVDYCGTKTTVEADAAVTPGLVVLKSLSKAYALSGIRAAYLVAHPETACGIRAHTPPWIVGTSAMAAAVAAVQNETSYIRVWRDSNCRTQRLAAQVSSMGLDVWFGEIPAILIGVPPEKTAHSWASELSNAGLIVRTPDGMGEVLGDRFIRIGLTAPDHEDRVLAILRSML